MRTLTSGEFFGVEEMLAGEKMKGSVTSRASASDCVVWTLDKEMFQDSMRDMLAKRVAFVPVAQSFFHIVPLVRDLPEEQISALAKACKVERFAEGQTVFKMGFHGDMLCFIYKGEAITQKPQDDGGFLELARQGRGEYFGEMALIRNARRTASVVAATELILLCLDKESFERLLSPLKEKMVGILTLVPVKAKLLAALSVFFPEPLLSCRCSAFKPECSVRRKLVSEGLAFFGATRSCAVKKVNFF